LFTAIGFQPDGSGRLSCTKILEMVAAYPDGWITPVIQPTTHQSYQTDRQDMFYQNFYLSIDAQENCFKRILKFTLTL